MRTYRYLHYDVFTETPFEGNQLAVFPEPAGLTTEEMQTITREMNFSECTFIFPSEAPGTNVRMRIFTPGEELPMAGHPTIGSTFALAKEGVIKPGQQDFVFGLGVGPTPVSIEWKGDVIDFAWMTQKNPTFGPEVKDRAGFARAIGVAQRSRERACAGGLVRSAISLRGVRIAEGRRCRHTRSSGLRCGVQGVWIRGSAILPVHC